MVFGALFFLLNVFFTLHIISMSRVCMLADRYVYLSSIGFFMPAVWFSVKFFMQLSKQKKIYGGIIVAIYILYLAGYAMKRTEVWHDNNSLKKEIKELLDKREPVKKEIIK
jgi:membrane-associated HD superfamily phosphohydrolase